MLRTNISRIILQFIAAVLILPIATLGILSFSFADPYPDFSSSKLADFQGISSEIFNSANTKNGAFKAEVILANESKDQDFQFKGFELNISDNSAIDKILAGITNENIIKVELWKNDHLIFSQTQPFKGFMKNNKEYMLSLDMFDSSLKKYKGKSHLSMRLRNGNGFLGSISEIAEINIDLSAYNINLSKKELRLFTNATNNMLSNLDRHFANINYWGNSISAD